MTLNTVSTTQHYIKLKLPVFHRTPPGLLQPASHDIQTSYICLKQLEALAISVLQKLPDLEQLTTDTKRLLYRLTPETPYVVKVPTGFSVSYTEEKNEHFYVELTATPGPNGLSQYDIETSLCGLPILNGKGLGLKELWSVLTLGSDVMDPFFYSFDIVQVDVYTGENEDKVVLNDVVSLAKGSIFEKEHMIRTTEPWGLKITDPELLARIANKGRYFKNQSGIVLNPGSKNATVYLYDPVTGPVKREA